MRILYVYSDWKWTGPSQPIVELCNSMSGHADCTLITVMPKRANESLISHIENPKIEIIPTLTKLGGFAGFLKNSKIIKQCIDNLDPDVVHTFRETDIAALPSAMPQSLSVFTDFKVTLPGMFRKFIWKKADVITVFSRKIKEILCRKFENIIQIHPWLDIKSIPSSFNRMTIRSKFCIDNNDFVVGVVMRLQPHRRLDLVLETAKCIKDTAYNIKFLILGRGKTKIVNDAKALSDKFGLGNTVIFGGYRAEDYWDAVNCFDVLLYTIAGSDGTARALRQC